MKDSVVRLTCVGRLRRIARSCVFAMRRRLRKKPRKLHRTKRQPRRLRRPRKLPKPNWQRTRRPSRRQRLPRPRFLGQCLQVPKARARAQGLQVMAAKLLLLARARLAHSQLEKVASLERAAAPPPSQWLSPKPQPSQVRRRLSTRAGARSLLLPLGHRQQQGPRQRQGQRLEQGPRLQPHRPRRVQCLTPGTIECLVCTL
mmetsp:Transcript_44189/g.80028  ORF Transcript_44189/g.80028 Transcript_44189/m.80028 type:complete len:201 (+) Transcript_44189:621-1223(+)